MNNKKRVNHSEENIYKTASNISYSQRSNKKHVIFFFSYSLIQQRNATMSDIYQKPKINCNTNSTLSNRRRKTNSIEKITISSVRVLNNSKPKHRNNVSKCITSRNEQYEIHFNRLVLNPSKMCHRPPTVYITLI